MTLHRLETLRSLSQEVLPTKEALSVEVVSNINRHVSNKSISAAFPKDTIHCPNRKCDGQLVMHSDHKSFSFVVCPICSSAVCCSCLEVYHPGSSCEKNKRRLHADDNVSTEQYIHATSKPCPSCQVQTTHWHGHACHHISPGKGCRNCGAHWCYHCSELPVEGKYWRCGLGSTYCRTDNLAQSIVVTSARPYPHDIRCSCPVCPDCDFVNGKSKPCELCTGDCIVCLGYYAKPSRELHVVAVVENDKWWRWWW
jgi:hypothetical protein